MERNRVLITKLNVQAFISLEPDCVLGFQSKEVFENKFVNGSKNDAKKNYFAK